jgi:pyruvate dehydrogenase (quinone)
MLRRLGAWGIKRSTATRGTGSWASSARSIDRPEQIADVWEQVFRSDRPVVVEAVTDPEVPPLPPHITLKQATAMTSALLKGDPGWRALVRRTYRDVLSAWKPHRG